MGYFVKNKELVSGENAVTIPSGATADRPTVAVDGQIRFNTTTGELEFFDSVWKDVAPKGVVSIVKDSFTGDGVAAGFTPMSQTPTSEESILVFVGNVAQNPGIAYTISGTTITFTSIPPNGEPITVLHNFDSTSAA